MSLVDDTELSRRLTAAIRGTAGVVDVYPAQPILEAAADAIAVKLALRQPDVLVDIDRAEAFTTVTAHIASSASIPAADTLRLVGELVRDALTADGVPHDELAVNVKVRFVDDTGRASRPA